MDSYSSVCSISVQVHDNSQVIDGHELEFARALSFLNKDSINNSGQFTVVLL